MLYLMRSLFSAVLAGTSLLVGQTAPSLPAWLIPYQDAAATTSASPTVVESSYMVPAKPEEVSAHYAKLLTSNGLTFQRNYDGLGTVIRASATECNLLIKVRESSAGAAVRISCATATAGLGSEVIVMNGSANPASEGARSRTAHLKSAEEIRQYNEERAREIKAKREAFERESNARMQVYDKPYYPQQQAQAHRPPPSNLAPPIAPIATYHDDAPALVWPAWLGTAKGETLSTPTRSSRGPESSLSRKYQTTVAMTELARFYKEGLESNGFTVNRSRITTGSTSTGVQQNASGDIEAYRKEGPGINPPTTTIKVGFSRMYLNEPISVWISVSVRGSFGR